MNALVKILTDWTVSTVVYFVVGFPIAYGISFLKPAGDLLGTSQGYDLIHFFFLLCFAACISAIISGCIASVIFVYGFHFEQEKLKIDDVLGVWPLHGVIGTWGGIAAGILDRNFWGEWVESASFPN